MERGRYRMVAAGSERFCSGEQSGKAAELGEMEPWVMVTAAPRANMPLRTSSQAWGKVNERRNLCSDTAGKSTETPGRSTRRSMDRSLELSP